MNGHHQNQDEISLFRFFEGLLPTYEWPNSKHSNEVLALHVAITGMSTRLGDFF